MWGDMSLWNVQGPLLHSGDHIVPRILTVDYTFIKDLAFTRVCKVNGLGQRTVFGAIAF